MTLKSFVHNMTISKQLKWSFAICISLNFIISFLALVQMFRLQHIANQIIINAEYLGQATQTSMIGTRSAQTMGNAVIIRDLEVADAEWQSEVKSFGNAQIELISKIANSPDEIDFVTNIRTNFDKIIDLYEQKMLPLLKDNKEITEEMKNLTNEANEYAGNISNSSLRLKNIMMSKISSAKDNFKNVVFTTLLITSLIVVLSLIIMVFISIKLVQSITTPLTEISNVAEKLALGEIEQDIDYQKDNEFGQTANSFRKMIAYIKNIAHLVHDLSLKNLKIDVVPQSDLDVLSLSVKSLVENLNNTLNTIRNSANQTANSSKQIKDTTEHLSQGATQQATSLQEITGTLNDLNTQTKNTLDNAVIANTNSKTAQNAAEQGQVHIENSLSAIRDINTSSEQIQKIVKVIDEIAFQTNLLALNAAVEAARAGKHGKGFAVVAEEVRNLSSRSAKAAKEINGIIESSGQKVRHGMEVTEQTAKIFSNINDAIKKVAILVENIASAVNLQATSLNQMTNALAKIDQVTQENMATAEETSAATKELSAQAVDLNAMLDEFSLKKVTTSQQRE